MTERSTNTTEIDRVFESLADSERRHVLYYLREHVDATVTELADVVTGWLAADRGDGRATPVDREGVETRLRDHHLPLLVEAGLVAVDEDTEVVSIASFPAHVEHLCDAAFAAEMARPMGRDAPANHEHNPNRSNDY